MLEVLRRYGRVSGMDTAEDAVRYCRNRFPELEISVGRVPESLPLPGSLDVVTAFDVIEHIREADRALSGIHNVLAPGGMFVCTVPAYRWLWGPHDDLNHHCRRYTRAELVRDLEKAGFTVEWASYFNTLLLLPAILIRLGRKPVALTSM